MGALASLHGILTSRRRRFFRIVMLTTVTLVTARASSATSLLTIALFILLGLATKIMEKRGSAASILVGCTLVLAVPVALMSLFDGGALLGMMGKDATLTGRTDIWEYVIPDIYQRPLLGWGYAAFWTADNPAAWKISDILRWWVPQAHNGVLEILLSVGFVGLVFYVFLLGRTWSLSLKCMRTADRQMGVTCFLLCIGIVVVGVSENVLIYTGGISFLFFTYRLLLRARGLYVGATQALVQCKRSGWRRSRPASLPRRIGESPPSGARVGGDRLQIIVPPSNHFPNSTAHCGKISRTRSVQDVGRKSVLYLPHHRLPSSSSQSAVCLRPICMDDECAMGLARIPRVLLRRPKTTRAPSPVARSNGCLEIVQFG